MITVSNALLAVLAHLQAAGIGHSIGVPVGAFRGIKSLDSWCLKHGLTYLREGRLVTLALDPAPSERF